MKNRSKNIRITYRFASKLATQSTNTWGSIVLSMKKLNNAVPINMRKIMPLMAAVSSKQSLHRFIESLFLSNVNIRAPITPIAAASVGENQPA